MLHAVARDLQRLPEVEPVLLLAHDEPDGPVPCRRAAPGHEARAFRALAEESDCSLLIAPETDGLLEERCRWAAEAGCAILGPDEEAVRLTGDKLALARHLADHSVPTPPTTPLTGASVFPAVCKPRWGAGSQSTYLVHDRDALAACQKAEPRVEFLVQPLLRGTAASVAFLVGPGRCVPLAPAGQTLSDDGRFHYLGGWAPLSDPLRQQALDLAGAAVACVPGLHGYVGVDVVVGPSGGHVIEINPRLTTSYVGLRRLANGNLAGALLAVAAGRAPRLTWREGRTVRWTPRRVWLDRPRRQTQGRSLEP